MHHCPRLTCRSFFRTLLLTAGLVFVTSSVPCEAQKPDDKPPVPVDPFVSQALPRLQKSEFDALIQECNKVLEAEPNKTNALLVRGLARNGKGEFDSAIQDFDKVVSVPGRDPVVVLMRAEAYTNRSTSYSSKGEYLKAIDSAYFALLEKGDHAPAHLSRAMAYIGRRQYDKAIQSCDRAIQSNAKSADAISLRGLAYGLKGNFDQCINDQKAAIELDSKLAVAYQRRAAAEREKKGDLKAAFQDLEKAIQLKPDFVEALCDRAVFFAMNGDVTRAMADLDEAIKLNPRSATARIQRARAYAALKNPEKAIENFDEAIKLKEDSAEAYSGRAYVLFTKKEYEAAVKDYTKAIALDPKLEAAYYGRSEAYKKLGRGKDEAADLAKVKEFHPPAPPKNAKKTEETTPRFQVTSKPVAPAKRADALRSAKEIDRMVEANFAKTSTTPNPPTTDAQFVRRIYLDITGTIPTYQQTQKFMSSSDPNKRAQLIDDLLNSDGYASHWFNYWADVLRYTDNLSFDVRGEPYRQWIKQSLAENKPWDKFVHEILTAEGLVWQSPMAGYLLRDSGMPLDNMNNTVRIFLGTRIGCAQCHDHPFDRWTQKEFYQMAAFTFGTLTSTGGYDKRYWKTDPNDRLREEYNEIEQEEEDRRNNSYRFDRVMSVNMRIVNDQAERKITLPKDYKYNNDKPEAVVEPKTLFGAPAEIRKGETPRKAFARWATAKDNPRFALTIANRLWKQAFGIGQIEPVDDMKDETVAENPELMKFLESEMKRLNFDMKEFLRMVYNSAAYQRQVCSDEIPLGEPYHFPGPSLRRMTAEQVWDSFLTLAVVDPDEYRELPSQVRTSVIGLDLTSVPAAKLLEAETKAAEVDGSQWKRQTKYTYKGTLLARASELPSPVPPSHFLRVFGQSDRELISASSTTGSVPQILYMFNGPITHMLLEPKTSIYNNVIRRKTDAERVKVLFLTILNREPDADEIELGKLEIKKNGAAGCGNIIWSLVNTREFLFVQ